MNINWDEARSRVQAGGSALEEVFSPSAETVASVLSKRAVQLATSVSTKAGAATKTGVLIFEVGREGYAIPLQELAEVLEFQRCTPIPRSLPRVLGVIAVRGELLPVLDLAGMLSSAADERGFVLILHRKLALKVDRIETLLEIGIDDLSREGHGPFSKGFVSGSVMLLDVAAVLSAVFPATGFPTKGLAIT
jgi:purine-binding chemotaxis protein CheW